LGVDLAADHIQVRQEDNFYVDSFLNKLENGQEPIVFTLNFDLDGRRSK